MASATVSYILAVAKFLKSLPYPDAQVEAQQVELVLDRIQLKGPDDAAEILLAIKQLPVSDEHMKSLMGKTTSLAMQSQTQQTTSGRRVLQDFSFFWKYFTEVKLDLFMQSSDKLSWLVKEATKLRLANPSERTYQVLTALVLMAGKNEDASPPIKYETLKAVKTAFARLKQTELAVGLQKLPEPSELAVTDPSIARSFFGDAEAGKCCIDAVFFANLVDSIPMRCTRKDSKVQSIRIDTGVDKKTMQFAETMAQQMQSMQYMQAVTLNALSGGGWHPTGAGNPGLSCQDMGSPQHLSSLLPTLFLAGVLCRKLCRCCQSKMSPRAQKHLR